MSKQTCTILCCLLAGTLIISCQKENNSKAPDTSGISQSVLDQITARGFSTDNVRKVNGGYLVEGDIRLSEKELEKDPTSPDLRIAEVEQYRTNNLVGSLPRVIRVLVTGLGSAYVAGTDTAIARYNRLGLRIQFQRISSGTADITIEGFYEGPSGGYITLGSSGFPTSTGDPYNSVLMNTHPQAYGSNPDVLYVGSVIQHEIGHCIGFRHTDYKNRAYSCGGRRVNEGSAGVGAVHIPGTPTGPDAASWMLACSNGGDRTFNANDRIALNYLYQ